jgi:hypothetical protein
MQLMPARHDVESSPDVAGAVESVFRAIHELPVEEHERVERGLAYAAVSFTRSGSTAELATFLDSLMITVHRHRTPEYGKALADAELDEWDDGGISADDLVAAGRQRRIGRRRRG